MAKQLNVNLSFGADTSKAKSQLQDLQRQLTQLINTSNSVSGTSGLETSLNKSVTAAAELKAHLQAATNTKTGNLDFSKLSDSLHKSGKSLKDYGDTLRNMGPEGQKAFQALASSVANAEIPIRRSNAALSEMWTTLKNTARWQISSSILHGFMGAVQDAYGYAQDLNESLNNIRIVTGQNIDQMSQFAENANKAAKALSTTTTAYTNAALIYYQQGDNDATVLEKTDVTTKMANVTGQEASVVSDQLTAIWNNFNKEGEESYEKYADILTALGAATASSTDEIAGGLEKFASIADMIGLSYEYAASALATITATTRQSEEVVGTALKTIFARIQGLKLGDTLDDGTDLNKYSQALSKVGISIFEQNGELKNMDTILNEMGEKWQSLSKDQQVALAQTVAGVRQYNQLVSLMDNWDFMEENLDIAYNSAGALDEQADIYAESWEAAQKRVTAAAEAIYSDLLNDEAFIDVLNIIEKILTGLDKFIDSIGGAKGVMTSLGAIITKVFSNQLSQSITNMAYSMKMLTPSGREEVRAERENFIKDAVDKIPANKEGVTTEEKARQDALRHQLTSQQKLIEQAEKMSQIELETNQTLMDRAKLLGENAIESAKALQAAEEEKGEKAYDMKTQVAQSFLSSDEGKGANSKEITAKINEVGALQNKLTKGIELKTNLKEVLKQGKLTEEQFEQIIKQAQILDDEKLNELIEELRDAGLEGDELKNKLAAIIGEVNNVNDSTISDIADMGVNRDDVEEYSASVEVATEAQIKNKQAAKEMEQAYQDVDDQIANSTGNQKQWSDHLVGVANSTLSLISGLQMLSTAWETASNPDLTPWERFSGTITGLLTAIPMLTMALSKESIQSLAAAAAAISHALGLSTEATAAGVAAGATTAFSAALWSILWPIGLVIAAIVGLIAIISALSNAYNADAIALERANEGLERSTNAFNEAASAAENFKNATKDFTDGIQSLENFTGTTEEFNAAIEESNKKARELIETYKLFDNYGIGSHGEIIIDQEALKTKQRELDHRADVAEMGMYSAQIHQQNAQLKNDATQLARNKMGSYTTTDDYGNAITQSVSGAQVREIGEAINVVRENANGIELDATTLREALVAQSEELNLSQDILNNLDTFINDSTLTSLYSFADSINSATSAVDYYTMKMMGGIAEGAYGEQLTALATDEDGNFDKALYENMTGAVTAILSRDDGEANIDAWVKEKQDALSTRVLNNVSTYDAGNVTETNVESLLKDILGDQYTDSYLKENYSKIFAGTSLEYDGNINSQEMAKAYYESLGYDITSVKDKNGHTSLSGFDANGNAWSLDVDNNEAQEEWAKQIVNYAIDQVAQEKATDILSKEDVAEMLGGITEAGESFGADFSNSILAGLQNNNDFDFSSLFKNFTQEEVDTMKDMTGEELAKMVGINPEDLGTLGFDSADAFKTAFVEGLEGFNYEENIESIKAQGEAEAQSLGIDVDEFKAYRDLLEQTTDAYKDNVEGLNDVAIANKRLEKGTKTLAKNWEDLDDIMSDETASLEDISSILPDVNDGLKDILNLDNSQFELLPPDFAQRNWNLVQDVMNGVDGAVDALRNKAGEEILLNIDGAVDPDGTINDELNALHQSIAGFDATKFEIGVQIDNAQFIQACNDMITKAGMTAEQAQAYFAAMGYDAEIQEQEVTKTTKRTIEYPLIDPRTGYPSGEKGQMELSETTGTTGYAIKTITPNGSYGGGVGVATSAPKSVVEDVQGSGSSKPAEEVERTKKTDVVDRYKEIDDTLDDISDEMAKANKQSDRLFGADRLKAIQKQNDLLLKQKKALEDKKKEAEENLAIDKKALQETASKYKINFDFDASGNVENYTAVLSKLYDELAAAEHKMDTAFSTKEEQDKFKESTVEPIEKKISEIKEALSAYEETRELITDLQSQIDDAFYEWQDNNLEQLEYKLELKIEINELELESIDYYMDKIADDFYAMGEAAGYMRKQYDLNKNSLSQYSTHFDDLTKAYNNNEISQAGYIEGLKSSYSAVLDNLGALADLDKEMMHYYEETLSAGAEELAYYTDQIDHQASKLEHYQNIVTMMNGEQDFDSIGTILEGTAAIAKNKLDISKSNYEILLGEKAAIEAQMAGVAEGSAAWELYKEELEAITIATNEAEEEMLANTEEWAEAMKAVMENTFAKAAYDLERSMTNGMGFDGLMNSLDRLSTYQDVYLTKTNQLYETNKMMRNMQDEINKTSNEGAKRRIKDFMDETKALQEKNQLSHLELEIQQKKYDVLLAEIALEEAQNAKAVVRLSRDNEGNFGYVYTADENAISDAEQELADAENDLYNTQLEATNDYGQKRIELQQQLMDELIALEEDMAAGRFATEAEYEEAKRRLIEEYDALFKAYGENYNLAMTGLGEKSQEAWVTVYDNVISAADNWKTWTTTYTGQCEAAFTTWKNTVSTESSVVKDLLNGENGVTKAVKAVTDESETLRKKAEEVTKQLDLEYESVRKVTSEYALQREELKRVQKEYENLAADILAAIRAKSELEGSGTTTQDPPKTPSTSTPGDDKPGAEPAAPSLAKGSSVTVKTSATRFTRDGGNGTRMQSWVPGSTFTVMGTSGNEVLIGRGGVYTGWVAKNDLEGFFTGGYTGEWGPEGKLALLHEKELILNQNDTQNLLSVVSMIHDIISQIDLRANNQSSFGSLLTSPMYAGSGDTLEQHVQIEANFPNATNRHEIEEAFGNLVNLASQYANRK